MKKNATLAAVLNFFLFGGGYLYNGKRKGLGLLLTIGVVLIRVGEIPIFLSGQNRNNWYLLMAGLACLQVALAMDAYREAKEIG
jgi:hypothetical protein